MFKHKKINWYLDIKKYISLIKNLTEKYNEASIYSLINISYTHLNKTIYWCTFADFKQYDTTPFHRCGPFHLPHFFKLVAEGYESVRNEGFVAMKTKPTTIHKGN